MSGARFFQKPDKQTINRITGDQGDEATMNAVVSNSAGIVFLRLLDKFQHQCMQAMLKEGKTAAQAKAALEDPKVLTEQFNQAYEHCQAALRALPVDDNTQSDIEYFFKKANEPSTALDQTTLTLLSDTGETTQHKMILPLKQVLVLVWQQLNENIQTEQDRSLIMQSFFNTLRRIHQGICHTGTRH